MIHYNYSIYNSCGYEVQTVWLCIIIDHLDYETGIENCSWEQYIQLDSCFRCPVRKAHED